MADVFVYAGVAIVTGVPANHQTPNLARFSVFYLSVLGLFISIKLLFTNKYKANRLHFRNMAVSPKPKSNCSRFSYGLKV